MMEQGPLKFRILEIFSEGPAWNDEVVTKLQQEYGMNSDHGRDMINYDIVELVSAGFLAEGESKIDEDGHYKLNSVLTNYRITKCGNDMLNSLKTTFKPQV